MRRLLAALAILSAVAVTFPTSSVAQTSPSPSATPSPQTFIPFRFGTSDGTLSSKILYVLAVGGDPATAQKLVGRLANQMQINRSHYAQLIASGDKSDESNLVAIVPEPSWGTADYISICQNSADFTDHRGGTAGALIIYVASVSNYTLQHILFGRTNLTDLVASMAYSPCVAVSPTPSPAPSATVPTAKHELTKGASKVIIRSLTDYTITSPSTPPKMQPYIEYETMLMSSRGKANIVTALPVIGLLLSVVSAWSVFSPSVTKSTQNLVTYPTPSPGLPLPPGGFVSTSTTVNSKTTNPAQFSAIGTGFYGTGLTYDSGSYSIQTNDLQGVLASGDLVAKLLWTIKCPWGDATPSPPPPLPPAQQDQKNLATPACLNILRGQDVYLQQTNEWQSGNVAIPGSNPLPSSTPL